MDEPVIKKQTEIKQKTGKEIIEIHEKLSKNGITPEDAIFYLMVHMDKMKVDEIGMDMSDSNGHHRSVVTRIIHDDFIPKPTKSTTPMVI
jgi:hypothetical protein